MPTGLERRNPDSGVHFVTVSCFRRQSLLGTPTLRDGLQAILQETQARYTFGLKAYVLMPEHIHLLLRLEETRLSTVMQVIKQRYSVYLKQTDPALYKNIETKTAHPSPMPAWETRYHDRNITTPQAAQQVIDYIHRNPVKRSLVMHSDDWPWSSYRQHQQVHTF